MDVVVPETPDQRSTIRRSSADLRLATDRNVESSKETAARPVSPPAQSNQPGGSIMSSRVAQGMLLEKRTTPQYISTPTPMSGTQANASGFSTGGVQLQDKEKTLVSR